MNEVVGVAGFIHPSDYVDVVTTMQTPVNGRSGELEFRAGLVGGRPQHEHTAVPGPRSVEKALELPARVLPALQRGTDMAS